MNMGELITWRILAQDKLFDILKTDVVLVKGIQADERDEYIRTKMPVDSKVIKLNYDPDAIKLSISFEGFEDPPVIEYDDPVTSAGELANFLNEGGRTVIVDITGLSTEALFLILQSFQEILFDNIVVTYVQPLEYKVERNEVLFPKYLLSQEHSPITPIPGFMRLPSDLKPLLVVFLGFEGGRFQELREYLLADGNVEITPILPLPSYSAGWHMRGLYLNLDTLKDSEKLQEIKRVTAWDPFHALKVLEKLYRNRSQEYQISVAPLGTKPHVLASALFAIKHEDVRIMYDHPKESLHRSVGIGEVRGYILRGIFT